VCASEWKDWHRNIYAHVIESPTDGNWRSANGNEPTSNFDTGDRGSQSKPVAVFHPFGSTTGNAALHSHDDGHRRMGRGTNCRWQDRTPHY